MGAIKGKIMKTLTCKKCEHKETLENINQSATTKILIAQVPRIEEKMD